jgi:hypothetical protein
MGKLMAAGIPLTRVAHGRRAHARAVRRISSRGTHDSSGLAVDFLVLRRVPALKLIFD